MKKMNYEAPEMELTTVKSEMNFMESFGTATGPNNIEDSNYHDDVAW